MFLWCIKKNKYTSDISHRTKFSIMDALHQISLFHPLSPGFPIQWTPDNVLVISTCKSIVASHCTTIVQRDQPETKEKNSIFPLQNLDLTTAYESMNEVGDNLISCPTKLSAKAKELPKKEFLKVEHTKFNMCPDLQEQRPHIINGTLKFSCGHCRKRYLLVLTEFNRLLLWSERNTELPPRWEVVSNLSTELEAHWMSSTRNKGLQMRFIVSALSKLVFTCMLWIDLHKCAGFNENHGCGLLCTGTQSGHVVLWTFVGESADGTTHVPKVLKAIKCNGNHIVALAFCGNAEAGSVNICATLSNGQIDALQFDFGATSTEELYFNSLCSVYAERDLLKVTQIKWLPLGGAGESVLVFAKNNAIICVGLDSSLNNTGRQVVNNKMHEAPVVFVNVTERRSSELTILTISSDGHIVESCLSLGAGELSFTQVTVRAHREKFRKVYGVYDDEDNQVMGADVSPNGVFLATANTRRPASLKTYDARDAFSRLYVLKRDVNVVQELIRSDKSPWQNCDWLQLLRVMHTRYAGEISDIGGSHALPTERRPLQYMWHILRGEALQSGEGGGLSESLETQRSAVQRKLMGLNMIKFLTSLPYSTEDDKEWEKAKFCWSSVKEVIRWLDANSLNLEDDAVPKNLRLLCSKLPDYPNCVFTDSSLTLKDTSFTLVSDENSFQWPLCIYTFLPVQENANKRFCGLCEASALRAQPTHPAWL